MDEPKTGLRCWLKRVTLALIVLVALALLSYMTTGMRWDGGFPEGEFRMNVFDPDGAPVQGATLRVYHGGTTNPAFGYPLYNHRKADDLVSDTKGRITPIRLGGGCQFGGFSWRLFWVVPMGARAPKFDCEISAEGYTPLTFPVQRLFRTPHRYYDDFGKSKITIEDVEVELPVYENTFTMKRN